MNLYFVRETKVEESCLRCFDVCEGFLAIGTLNKKLLIYSFDQGSEFPLKTFDFFESPVYSVKFLPNKLIAIGCVDKNIYIVDHNGDLTNQLEGHEGIVSTLKCRDNLMASGSWDATCKIWDTTSFQCIKTLPNHKYAVTCEFLANKTLVTGSQDGILYLWDQDFNLLKQVKAHTDIIRKII